MWNMQNIPNISNINMLPFMCIPDQSGQMAGQSEYYVYVLLWIFDLIKINHTQEDIHVHSYANFLLHQNNIIIVIN